MKNSSNLTHNLDLLINFLDKVEVIPENSEAYNALKAIGNIDTYKLMEELYNENN